MSSSEAEAESSFEVVAPSFELPVELVHEEDSSFAEKISTQISNQLRSQVTSVTGADGFVVIGAGSAGLVTAYIGAAVKAKVTLVDRWFGKLLDALDETGLADNTALLLTSESGGGEEKTRAAETAPAEAPAVKLTDPEVTPAPAY